jgi:hypothetical protein
MRKFILAAVVALPLAALGQERAMAGGGGDCCTPLYRIGLSVGLVFRGWCGCDYSCCKQSIGHCHGGKCGGGGCSFPGGGPWYGAWPYPAHFQTPAPTGYPYWPAPMTYHAAAPTPDIGNGYAASQMGMPGMDGYGNAALAMPVGGNYGGFPMNVAAIQPAGYYPQAPAYWYPR